MANSTFHPTWWKEEQHGSAWERVKDAMKRDWEQTKNDIKAGGRDLDQDVDDTVKQAAGKDPIPPPNQPNAPQPGARDKNWDEVETPIAYGLGARDYYAKSHTKWDDKLEGTLKQEWESAKDTTGRKWDDVKTYVRHGYERAKN